MQAALDFIEQNAPAKLLEDFEEVAPSLDSQDFLEIQTKWQDVELLKTDKEVFDSTVENLNSVRTEQFATEAKTLSGAELKEYAKEALYVNVVSNALSQDFDLEKPNGEPIEKSLEQPDQAIEKSEQDEVARIVQEETNNVVETESTGDNNGFSRADSNEIKKDTQGQEVLADQDTDQLEQTRQRADRIANHLIDQSPTLKNSVSSNELKANLSDKLVNEATVKQTIDLEKVEERVLPNVERDNELTA